MLSNGTRRKSTFHRSALCWAGDRWTAGCDPSPSNGAPIEFAITSSFTSRFSLKQVRFERSSRESATHSSPSRAVLANGYKGFLGRFSASCRCIGTYMSQYSLVVFERHKSIINRVELKSRRLDSALLFWAGSGTLSPSPQSGLSTAFPK